MGPEAKVMEPPHLLGPAGKTLTPHHIGLRNSPVKGLLSGGQKNCPNSSARDPKKHFKGPAPFKIREEGGRRDDHFEAPLLVDDAPRYVEFNSEDSPSSLITVFGRPLLLGGSSGQVGFLKPNEVVDLESLRMVAVDGSDWGLESSGALVALEDGSVGVGQ